MSRRVSISLRAARALRDLPTTDGFTDPIERRALEELRSAIAAAMAPKKSVSASRVRRVAKKATKKASAKNLRTALIERSRGLCEMGEFPHAGTDPHHALGRKGLAEGPHNCLWLCRAHHELVTNPGDEAPGYFRLQAAAFDRMGFPDAAHELRKRADFAESRIKAGEALGRAASMTRGAP